MQFHSFEQNASGASPAVRILYTPTWPVSPAFVRSFAQTLLAGDFRDPKDLWHLELDGKESVFLAREAGLDLTKLDGFAICSDIALEGVSRVMDVPVRLSLRAGSSQIALESRAVRYFAKYGGHVFDRYMDSIEIEAWCRVALASQKDRGKS
jgi:hypothetical protein